MNKFISRCRRHNDSWDWSLSVPTGCRRTMEGSLSHRSSLIDLRSASSRLLLLLSRCSCSWQPKLANSCVNAAATARQDTSTGRGVGSCCTVVHLLFRSWRVPSSPVLTIIIATTSSHSWRIPLPPSFLLICEDAAALSLFWRRLWCDWVGGNVEQGWSKLSVWLKSLCS